MPYVSVIVPVYNVAPYLRECLDSLVNQTLKEIEIICVDDGSTDKFFSWLWRINKSPSPGFLITESVTRQCKSAKHTVLRYTLLTV